MPACQSGHTVPPTPWREQAYQNITAGLTEALRTQTLPQGLQDALAYSLFSPGKRLRPLLLLAAGEALRCPPEKLQPLALALEMMHTYSLVHDDLPGMDDDSVRRGQATSHIMFDHATAILVGDALQALAYETILRAPSLSADEKITALTTLNHATGASGMVAGQYLDWHKQQHAPQTPAEKQAINPLKTGLCLQCALTLPLACSPHSPNHLIWQQAGATLGLAYQYLDDHIDAETDLILDDSDCPAYLPTAPAFSSALSKASWLAEQAIALLRQVPLQRTDRLPSLLCTIFSLAPQPVTP